MTLRNFFRCDLKNVTVLTVSLGRAASILFSALFMSSGLPSKNRPQPATKSVSPEKIHKQKLSITLESCETLSYPRPPN